MPYARLVTEEQRVLFDTLYTRYWRAMCNYAHAILKPDFTYLTEDVVHDAFFAIAKNMNTISRLEETSRTNYIIKTVKSHVFDVIDREKTKQKHEKEVETVMCSDPEILLNEICQKESVETITDAIRSLGERYSDLLILHIFDGLSLREIASLYEMKYDTVKKQYQRAIKYLIRILEKRGISYATQN